MKKFKFSNKLFETEVKVKEVKEQYLTISQLDKITLEKNKILLHTEELNIIAEEVFSADRVKYKKVLEILIKSLNFMVNKESKKELSGLLEKNNIETRICSECGNLMTEGYCIEDGESYYCCDTCLEKDISKEEFSSLYNDGEGNSYWTEWN